MTRGVQPAVGWRLWRLQDDKLCSWAVDYVWEPGDNWASCLADRIPAATSPCADPPGEGCMCGFWGLWNADRCFVKARREAPWGHPGFHTAFGLMTGWGTVAVHGDEGFRAEHATVGCLFDNSPWDPELDMLIGGRKTWGASLARVLERIGTNSSDRDRSLRAAADRYSVPLVSLTVALRIGLLSELGVPAELVREIETRLPRTHGSRSTQT